MAMTYISRERMTNFDATTSLQCYNKWDYKQY